MRERARNLASAIEMVGDAVIVLGGGSGRVRSLNEAAQSLVGWPAEEAVGSLLIDILKGARCQEMQRRLSGGGHDSNAQYCMYSRDGNESWVTVREVEVPGENGSAATILVLRDVTQQRAAEARLRQ